MKIEVNQKDIQTCGLFQEMDYMELKECYKIIRKSLIKVVCELHKRDAAIGRSTADNWNKPYKTK